jgi:hypothetical protein
MIFSNLPEKVKIWQLILKCSQFCDILENNWISIGIEYLIVSQSDQKIQIGSITLKVSALLSFTILYFRVYKTD